MRKECLQAVSNALGRAVTQAEGKDIEQGVLRAHRNLARKDPAAWAALSQADRLQQAGVQAAQELLGERALKQQRESLTILAHARITQHVQDSAARGLTGLDAIDRIVAFHADGKSNFLSMESQANAIRNDSLRQMLGTIEASHPKWFGLIENLDGVNAIIKELFGENSGDADARAGAQEFQKVAEQLRERFNRAGGDVGSLEDWGLPHHHSQLQVAKAGRDQWIADVLPKLNRDAYLNEDGTPMSDTQLGEFLNHAWVTIATGGANKVEPGVPRGAGARANRGSESRQIHFKDADSYMEYQAKYGERSLYEVLIGHIAGVSKDVALVETMGPNPDHTFRFFRDSIVKDAKLADPVHIGKVDERAVRTDSLYNYVAGKTQPVASEWLAKSFDTLRNWLIASRLGSSVITSFSDDATLHLTGKINNLSPMRLLANELAALNPANRLEERMALRAGLAMNTMLSTLNRFGQDGLRSGFSKRLAGTTLRASGLNAMTEARKRAFGVTMMGSVGGVVKDHATLKDIDPQDHRILLSKGITDTDFAVWKKAQLEDWGSGNDTMLTPESIYRIPDAAIDQVIAPQVADLKAEATTQIVDLATRAVKDQEWVNQRATNLRQWVAKGQAKLAARIAGADAATASELTTLKEQIAHLDTQIELSKAFWQEAVKPTSVVREVGSATTGAQTGKTKLRTAGTSEGQAREAIKSLKAEARDIGLEMKRLKASLTDAFVEQWSERQADLMDFAAHAQERIERRAKVMDRIQRGIEPAIADARSRAREQAATRLLGAVLEETDVAVIEPGAKERLQTGAGLQRGTWKGELTRSFFLFKSFPLAMIERHWQRGMSLPNRGGSAAYLATLLAATTVLGMASLQVSEVLAGRDPRNMNLAAKGGTRNWIAAMLKGGSLGIYGDFLFSGQSQHGSSPLATLTGPVLGLGEDFLNLTQGNLIEAAQGKPTNAGAELVRFARSNLPGASLWYAKAGLDHLVFHQLQEYFSPGYLASMRSRSAREFGQKYWWEPGTVAPQRLPDLGAAVGE